MKSPPLSTLSGFFDKKIQIFDEWNVEVFEHFFEFWPTVCHPTITTAVPDEAELSLVSFACEYFTVSSPPQSWTQAVVWVRMYLMLPFVLLDFKNWIL